MTRRTLAALALACACVTEALPVRASDLVEVAARYEHHTNPTGMAHAWCARFLRMILPQAGLSAPGANDLAGSFLSLPRSGPHRNAIAILGRHGRATHVAIVESVGRDGVAIISGNWSGAVKRGVVPAASVLAFVEAPRSSAILAKIPWPIRHRGAHHHRSRHHHRR